MSKIEEKIRVLFFALEELKMQLLRSDSPLLRAEYNVVIGKINKLGKEHEQETNENTEGSKQDA